ncbi:MAG: type II toxin-antitoxin system VapC family toxin [Gaiellaceae bacterium]
MSDTVMDASAVLAFVQSEPGSTTVAAAIAGAAMSTVNWSEVCKRLVAHAVEPRALRTRLNALGLQLIPFGAEDAESAAALWPTTRHAGLSLADRACLALAQRLGRPALTADRSWLGLDVGVEVRAIR